MTDVPKHPATFSAAVLDVITAELTADYADRLPASHGGSAPDGTTGPLIIDPFAGTGGIHSLADFGFETIGVELEPEWAAAHPSTIAGDWFAQAASLPDNYADLVVTSPCYGNRMADHHEARDDSRRVTYRHYLGRPLTKGSAAAMQWGPAYRRFHLAAWREALRIGRRLVVNISDHVRDDELQQVPEWHVQTIQALGGRLYRATPVETPRMKMGANHEARAEFELVLTFLAPDTFDPQERLL